MAKADDDDILALYEDILDCIDGDFVVDVAALRNVLRLGLEAEYSVGYEDGCIDTRNEDILKLRSR